MTNGPQILAADDNRHLFLDLITCWKLCFDSDCLALHHVGSTWLLILGSGLKEQPPCEQVHPETEEKSRQVGVRPDNGVASLCSEGAPSLLLTFPQPKPKSTEQKGQSSHEGGGMNIPNVTVKYCTRSWKLLVRLLLPMSIKYWNK